MIALPGAALREPITAGTIFPALTYGLTVVLYLGVRHRLDRQAGAFDLGRFELPVTISALVWSAAALFVLVAPAFSRAPLVIVGGALVVGSAYFVGLFTLRRNVLATEPGT
jgi:hypothetical protein